MLLKFLAVMFWIMFTSTLEGFVEDTDAPFAIALPITLLHNFSVVFGFLYLLFKLMEDIL
jgi:ABC-type polysaccharide/polyol phosphate export permease